MGGEKDVIKMYRVSPSRAEGYFNLINGDEEIGRVVQNQDEI